MRTTTGPFKSLSQHRTADTRVECSHEVLGTDLVQGFRPVDPEPRCTTTYQTKIGQVVHPQTAP